MNLTYTRDCVAGRDGAPAPSAWSHDRLGCLDAALCVARTTTALRAHVRRADDGRAGLRAAAVDGRAGAARPAARAEHDAHGRQLDLHDLPALGLDRDARSPAGWATCSARSACSSSCSSASPSAPIISALSTSIGPMIAGRGLQGIGGAVFPLGIGIVRDEFPRERVATGIALISATFAVGGGIGIMLAGPIVAAPQLPLPLLDPARAGPDRARRDLAVGAGVARAQPGPGQLAGCDRCSRAGSSACCSASARRRPGTGSRARDRPVRDRRSCCCSLWVRAESRSSEPLVDMKMMRVRGVWTVNLATVLIGFGMYNAFILIPQFVEAPDGDRLRLRRERHRRRPLPAADHRDDADLEPDRRPHGRARRIAHPADRRRRPSRLWRSRCWPSRTRRSGRSTSASGILGIGIGLAFASMSNLIVEAVSSEQTGIATGMNTIMRTVGGALGTTIAASILAGSLAATACPRRAAS